MLEWNPPQRGVHVRVESLLERSAPQRGVCLRELSILERCPFEKKMSTLERFPPQSDVHLSELSILERYPLQRGVYLRELTTLGSFPPWRGLHLREVSTLGRGPSYRVLYLREESILERYVFTLERGHLRDLSTLQKCPLKKGIRLKLDIKGFTVLVTVVVICNVDCRCLEWARNGVVEMWRATLEVDTKSTSLKRKQNFTRMKAILCSCLWTGEVIN